MLKAWHLPVAPFVQKRDDSLFITLWLSGDNLPEQVLLRYEMDNEETPVRMQRKRSAPQAGIMSYQAAIPLTCGQPRRRYSFKCIWAGHQQWFTPQGFQPTPPASLAQFATDEPDDGPQWVAEQIFYQIFPDRFARSQTRQEGQDAIYYHHAAQHDIIRREWDEPLTDEAGGSTFYGGDLDGISEKLPWLAKLGVTALYLNPIFTAPSVHKYDTEDYRHVDVQFGGDLALHRLCDNLKKRDMRLLLDGVFNHSGDTHPWFDRHQQSSHGACHNQHSAWRDWYSFSPEGMALDWKGYSSLPKLDYQSQGLVNEVYQGENSIVRYWLRAPWRIDGWRLDVVHMLGEQGGAKNNLLHVLGITRAAKETNPQAYILGEHFGDARQWLQADAEDASMNYRGFTLPVWGFLANTDMSLHPVSLSAEECAAWMDEYRAGLSHQQQLRMFNQLDSHDTSRFITVLGEQRHYLPLAVVWLFCWPGVPCIYYGDEVGLDGANDPFCRKPFPWHKAQQDADILALYRRMAKLRHQSKALKQGACQIVHASHDVFAFVRVYQRERVLVAINRGEPYQGEMSWSPLLADKNWQCVEGEGSLTAQTLHLPQASVTVWRAR